MPETPRPPALPGDQAQPLNPGEAAAWAEVTDRLTNLAQRMQRGEAASDEDLRLPQVDVDRVLNAVQVPTDAGAYAADLERILSDNEEVRIVSLNCDPSFAVETAHHCAVLDLDVLALSVPHALRVID